jgi:glutathione S-transferase
MTDAPQLRVYGAEVSYYTGKLEGYLRYKEIPYERIAMTPRVMARVARETGASQMPAVELPDGRWLTDTTPTIAWFEREHPSPAVIPPDPLQGFVSRLVEDYADEWMWRPAMHYRWSYTADARLLSRKIVEELVRLPLPAFLRRLIIVRRQYGFYVKGDGVSRETRAHVESIYLRTLDQLQAILERRPFLLGARPTLADFGFFASMFRHFGLDPTASQIMRERAPAVYEWLARLWNAGVSQTDGDLVAGIPDDWSPILREIGTCYLPYLCANAQAWEERRARFDHELEGVHYRRVPLSRYRVWCLEQLRAHFDALPDGPRAEARTLLEAHGCWEPLWRVKEPASGIDPEGRAPFAPGTKVHYDNRSAR